jgi:hypothetical protein
MQYEGKGMAMDLFESSSAFGRLDTTHFGSWLNMDNAIRHPDALHVLPLLWSSFHLPIGDEHRDYVSSLKDPEEIQFAVMAFTAAAHEARHFHDLLLTPYGSVLLRQYTRAALLALSLRNELLFRSRAAVVPLTEWAPTWETLHVLDPDVEAPPANVLEVAQAFDLLKRKLRAFDEGWFVPNLKISATSILEALATVVQGRVVNLEFGAEATGQFMTRMRNSPARRLYLGTLEWLLDILGPMPVEAVLLILLAALSGDFQSQDEQRVRYPKDLLLTLVSWLRKRHIVPGKLSGLDELRNSIDDFFTDYFGDDLQGLMLQAVRVNVQASEAFTEMVDAMEATTGPDPTARGALVAFNSLVQTGGAWVGNLSQDPKWYCTDPYVRQVLLLPRSLVFLWTEIGIPITPELNAAYYVQSEWIVQSHSDTLRPLLKALSQESEVLRIGSVLIPRPELVLSTEVDLGVPCPYIVPELDLTAWTQYYDDVIPWLRMLLDGESANLPGPSWQSLLGIFSEMGTSVYSPGGPIPLPDPNYIFESLRHDSLAKPEWLDPGFRNLLAELRRRKGRLA